MKRESAPPSCAACGADIPAGARACPECGADERTGWREASLYDGLDLPEETTTAGGWRGAERRFPWVSLVATILLVLALLLMYHFSR